MELSRLFKIGVILMTCAFTPLMYRSFAVYLRCRSERPDFPYPIADFTEFWKAAVSAICCVVTKPLVRYLVSTKCEKIAKDQEDPKLLAARVHKMTEQVWTFCYTSIMMVYGWHILGDSEWLPTYLGGHGSFDNFYKDVPWTVPIDGAVTFALI